MSLPFDVNLIKQWFLQNKRDLPWRDNPNPYQVWVSEVMLQQTQVTTVIPYYERWMKHYPNPHALANAPLNEVIKNWEGLGYYSRARNLHAGAQYVVKVHQGKLPSSTEELCKIKGLGPYTIGAIQSFAFHKKAAAVDGNGLRVLSRLFLIQEDVGKTSTIKRIWKLAESILPDEEPWIIVEALIELGATLCQRKPQCQHCPLKKTCQGYIQGVAEKLPFKSKKISIEKLHRIVTVIIHKGRLLIRRGEKGQIMSDLHEFPYFELTKDNHDQSEALNFIEKSLKLKVRSAGVLNPVSQSFTRYQVKLFPYLFEANEALDLKGYEWATLTSLRQLAFSSGHRKILNQLDLTP